MDLITGDMNPLMTIEAFEDTFKNVFFPIFSENDASKFFDTSKDAIPDWQIKIRREHKTVEQLKLKDRPNKFNFEKMSIVNEMYYIFCS